MLRMCYRHELIRAYVLSIRAHLCLCAVDRGFADRGFVPSNSVMAQSRLIADFLGGWDRTGQGVPLAWSRAVARVPDP